MLMSIATLIRFAAPRLRGLLPCVLSLVLLAAGDARGACSLTCSGSIVMNAIAGDQVPFEALATATGCTGSPAFQWSFGDGTTSSLRSGTHVYANPGLYPVTLSVSIPGASTCTKAGTVSISYVPLPGDDVTVSTLAGRPGVVGKDDGPAEFATFSDIEGLVPDAAGNIFVADFNNTIRKISTAGVVTTVAGRAGSSGYADGPPTQARFHNPRGMVFDANGILFVADYFNCTIRKVAPDGQVSTFVGTGKSCGAKDGWNSEARFNNPDGLALGRNGFLYVADSANHTIRVVSPDGKVMTLAGQAGTSGYVDGSAFTARFRYPHGLSFDDAGNLYVSEGSAGHIRKISPDGVVTTVLDMSTSRYGEFAAYPEGITVAPDGALYIVDWARYAVFKLPTSDPLRVLAGLPGSRGTSDGAGPAARFYMPTAITWSPKHGALLVADSSNHTIRKIAPPPSPVADLVVRGGANPGPRLVGSETTWTLTVTNDGPTSATESVLEVDVPPLFAGVSGRVSTSGSCTGAPSLRCTLGALEPGAAATVTVSGIASAAGVAHLRARAQSSTTESDPATNVFESIVEVLSSTPGQMRREFFVPVVLSSSGANGSYFTTELTLTNRGTRAVAALFSYTAAAGGGSGTTTIPEVVGAGLQTVVPDAITFLAERGLPIPTSGNRVGTLRASFDGLDDPLSVSLTARTTTAVANPAGRAGLAYSGVPPSRLLTGTAIIPGLRYDAANRSNLAIQNAGDPADGPATFAVTVTSGDPAVPFEKVLPPLVLEPGGFQQYSPGDMGLASGFQGVARVERVSGTAPFFAYGVVNDQGTSDGSFILPIVTNRAGDVTGLTVPVAVETAAFSTELVLSNRGTSALAITIRLASTSGVDASANFQLLPREQRIFPKVVDALRQAGASIPGQSLVGPLFVTRTGGGSLASLSVGARTSSAGGAGRFGLYYEAIPFGGSATGLLSLSALRQDADNRTNLACVNTGEHDGGPIDLKLEIFDGRTGALAATDQKSFLGMSAQGFVQLDSVLKTLAPSASNGYARVTRTSGGNPFLCYAVINDGGIPRSRTDDGAFIAADE